MEKTHRSDSKKHKRRSYYSNRGKALTGTSTRYQYKGITYVVSWGHSSHISRNLHETRTQSSLMELMQEAVLSDFKRLTKKETKSTIKHTNKPSTAEKEVQSS